MLGLTVQSGGTRAAGSSVRSALSVSGFGPERDGGQACREGETPCPALPMYRKGIASTSS
jgi:hypothetical protein